MAEPSTTEESSAKEESFDTSAVVTVSAAHMVHDIYPAFLAPLLPLLITNLSIPLAAAGGLATIFRTGSLVQPFLGLWADRADTRYFVIAAPTVTALCMSLLGVAPNYLSVALLLVVAGLSSAAFHPSAAAAITRSSGRTWGRGSSLYMFGGEIGRSVGPIFIVAMIAWVGLERSYLAAIPGALFSLVLYRQLWKRGTRRMSGSSVASIWKDIKEQRRALLLLSGLILFRSTAVQSIATFYPTYLTGSGSSLVYAGLALSLYELAGAGGALVGGTLSDVFGRRRLMLGSQLVSGPLLYLALSLPEGPMAIAVLAVAGAVALSASPVQLTLAQELLPGGRSTASGIVFFLGFEGTLISTLAVGAVGDWIGLGPALGAAVLGSMLSIPFTLALPEPRETGIA
ncbi:MAG: MFS transporter [Chloroflexota bacterium]